MKRTQGIFAGVDVGGTRIKAGIADSSGRLLACQLLDTREYHDADSLLDAIAGTLENQAGAVSEPIAAAGVGCPGRIDFDSGKVVWLKTKLAFLEGVPLASRLVERLRCEVVCDNDVNAVLAGEMRFGAGRGYRDVVALTLGTGIGGALMAGGSMVRGKNWAAGHFGYMSHHSDGPRHVCGNTGIAEERASQSGVLEAVRRALQRGEPSSLTAALARGDEPGLRELFQAADDGDLLAAQLARGIISELSVLIANLIYALDPEMVLLGGGIVTYRPGLLDAVRAEVTARVKYLSAEAICIRAMELGDAAGVLGGVALAFDALAKSKIHSDGSLQTS